MSTRRLLAQPSLGRLACGERDLAHETASCISDAEPIIYERAAGRSVRGDGSDRRINAAWPLKDC